MISALEKRLRDLMDVELARLDAGPGRVSLHKSVARLLLSAARIGADFEREECAREIERSIADYGDTEHGHLAAAVDLIRTRGAK